MKRRKFRDEIAGMLGEIHNAEIAERTQVSHRLREQGFDPGIPQVGEPPKPGDDFLLEFEVRDTIIEIKWKSSGVYVYCDETGETHIVDFARYPNLINAAIIVKAVGEVRATIPS